MLTIALLILMAADPTDAAGWYSLGNQRLDAGDARGALTAYTHAEEMHYTPVFPLWLHESRAHARLDEEDASLALLEKLAKYGYAQSSAINAENDFLSVRRNPRYAAVIQTMNANAHVCTTAEYRQFDYWLGEWDVEANGNRVARSSVQLILDECVVFENFEPLQGGGGKSFSLYDRATKQWQQRYVDSSGRLQEWTNGHLENGVMVFTRDAPFNGTPAKMRMSYFKETPEKVRQLIEMSMDAGKTWQTTFDGQYTRRR